MRHCSICKKTSKMGGTRKLLRGHYNPTNWSRKYPNLQTVRIPEGGFKGLAAGRQVLACTRCIRTFGKAARLEKNRAERKQKAEKAKETLEKRKEMLAAKKSKAAEKKQEKSAKPKKEKSEKSAK